MRILSARIVITLVFFSATFDQLVEMGHAALHTLKNPFHYHAASSVGNIKDHTLVDHHFPKMKFAYQMEEPPSPSNFFAIALFFFQPLPVYQFSSSPAMASHLTRHLSHYHSIDITPPNPPPLS